MYKIDIHVKLKENVLDPQGKVIKHAANEMGYKKVKEVKQGKYFEIIIKDISDVEKYALQIAKNILANEVIEDFKIIKIKRV